MRFLRVKYGLCLFFYFTSIVIYAQAKDNDSGLPSCQDVRAISIDIEEAIKTKKYFKYMSVQDTLEYLYCYSKENGLLELEAMSLLQLASNRINVGYDNVVFERFIILLNRAISICEENGFNEAWLFGKEMLCSNLTSNKMFDLASVYANEIIDKAIEINDSEKLAEGKMLLGRIYREEGKFLLSDSILQSALLDLTSSDNSKRIESFIYLHLSNLKRQEGKFSESILYARKGLYFAKKVTSIRDFIEGTLALELILSSLELNEAPEESWLEMLRKGSLEYKWLIGHYESILGRMYEEKGQSDAAITSYMNSLRNSSEAGSLHYSSDITDNIFDLLYNSNEISPRAYEIYKISKAGFDRIIRENGSNNLIKNTYLKLENEKARSEILGIELRDSQRKFAFTVIVTTFSFLVFGLIYWQNKKNLKLYDKIKHLNKNLSHSNSELRKSNNELKTHKNDLSADLKEQLLLNTNQNKKISNLEVLISKDENTSSELKKHFAKLTEFQIENNVVQNLNLRILENHKDLLGKLSFDFPNLTSNELNLCVYLSMNLSSKEIAEVLHKSVESVKVARSRLRKKLKVDSTAIKLSAFLNSYQLTNNTEESYKNKIPS